MLEGCWRGAGSACYPNILRLPREGVEAGQPLAGALHSWACELPLGMQLVAATHGAAGLATPAGRQRIAAQPRAAAAVRSSTLQDAVQVQTCRAQPVQRLSCSRPRMQCTSPTVGVWEQGMPWVVHHVFGAACSGLLTG